MPLIATWQLGDAELLRLASGSAHRANRDVAPELRGTAGIRSGLSVSAAAFAVGSFERPRWRRRPRTPSPSADRARRRCFAAQKSADRPRSRRRRAQPARGYVREPGRSSARRRANTNADATATPPAPARERGDRRRSSSSSQSRTRPRAARSPTSRCPQHHTTASNAAAATPPPQAAQASAGPDPPAATRLRSASDSQRRGAEAEAERRQ